MKAKKQFKAPRKVLGTKKQTENRSANDMLGFLMPETGDFASVADEIFGTPLPDDDEDSTSGAKEAHVSKIKFCIIGCRRICAKYESCVGVLIVNHMSGIDDVGKPLV